MTDIPIEKMINKLMFKYNDVVISKQEMMRKINNIWSNNVNEGKNIARK